METKKNQIRIYGESPEFCKKEIENKQKRTSRKLLTVLFVFVTSLIMLGQFDALKSTNCIRKSSVLGNTISSSDLRKMGIDSTKKYYFIGEKHYQKSSSKTMYKLITELNHLAGIKTIVLELARSWEEDFNNYVTTGNAGYLEKFYEWWDPENAVEVKASLDVILSVNRSLEGEMMNVKCIDIPNHPNHSLFMLNKILQRRNLSGENEKEVYMIKKMSNQKIISRKKVSKNANDILQSVYRNNDYYKKHLQKDYDYFVNILKTLIVLPPTGVFQGESFTKRENMLYRNFYDIIKADTTAGIIGEFGSAHTVFKATENINNGKWKPFVNMLCDSLNIKNKICSFVTLYNGAYDESDGAYGKKNIDLMRDLFHDEDVLIETKCLDTSERKYSDLCQYIIWTQTRRH